MAWFGRRLKRTAPSPLTADSTVVLKGTQAAVASLAHEITTKEGEYISKVDKMAETLRSVIKRMEKDGERIHSRG